MTPAMVPASQAIFPSRTGTALPALILRAGEKARWRFIDFFTATIRNPNTRRAYYRAVSRFLNWCQTQGIGELDQVRPIHVAAYVEQLQGELSRPSVKQHLAAIRKCLNWLLSGGVLEMNPASPVQGPKYIVRLGQTPILDAEETRQLLDSIPLDYVVGLRDRALVGVMLYTFGRVGAVTAMNVEDYFVSGRRPMFRLHEKGGRTIWCPPTTTPRSTSRSTWRPPVCGTAPRPPCSSRRTRPGGR